MQSPSIGPAPQFSPVRTGVGPDAADPNTGSNQSGSDNSDPHDAPIPLDRSAPAKAPHTEPNQLDQPASDSAGYSSPCSRHCPRENTSASQQTNANGSVKRYNPRLTRFSQVEGIDFHRTYTSIAKLVSVGRLLKVVVARGWELHYLDVNNAFSTWRSRQRSPYVFAIGFLLPVQTSCVVSKSVYTDYDKLLAIGIKENRNGRKGRDCQSATPACKLNRNSDLEYLVNSARPLYQGRRYPWRMPATSVEGSGPPIGDPDPSFPFDFLSRIKMKKMTS
ncbi:hypothetical protein CRG98_002533 [Punica granatum]|uniref:Reverse transcriptase Ty1/copia-type domain-containing protein n=1 Tax=Punica granatum TaxID=22663 RepID=A0A2I0L8Q3_PUNGR|nr:hypothetical protein CRG98_002533 [Punica granatum]